MYVWYNTNERGGIIMQSLANCPHCGDVFVKSLRNICPSCYKKEEEAFDIVYQFLRKQKNREAKIHTIAEATGVEEELIIKFVKENRLRSTQFPNLSFPCEQCGDPIVTGKVCSNCSNELLTALQKHEAIEEKKQSLQENRKQSDTYFALENERRK